MTKTRGATSTGVPEFHLGDRLRKSLDVAGMSVQDMADHLGVSRNTVSNYLALRTTPSRSVVRDWSLRCGVPFEWVLTGRLDLTDGPDGDPATTATSGSRRGRTQRRSSTEWYVSSPIAMIRPAYQDVAAA